MAPGTFTNEKVELSQIYAVEKNTQGSPPDWRIEIRQTTTGKQALGGHCQSKLA